MANTPKPSAKVMRVLRKIKANESWRASWETVEEITAGGYARFLGFDDVNDPRDCRWVLTALGAKIVCGK